MAEIIAQSDAEFTLLGEVAGEKAVIDDEDFGSIRELDSLYKRVIPDMMDELPPEPM